MPLSPGNRTSPARNRTEKSAVAICTFPCPLHCYVLRVDGRVAIGSFLLSTPSIFLFCGGVRVCLCALRLLCSCTPPSHPVSSAVTCEYGYTRSALSAERGAQEQLLCDSRLDKCCPTFCTANFSALYSTGGASATTHYHAIARRNVVVPVVVVVDVVCDCRAFFFCPPRRLLFAERPRTTSLLPGPCDR